MAARPRFVLADDFVGEVNRRMHDDPRPPTPFTLDRVGGYVVGKNLPQSCRAGTQSARVMAGEYLADRLGALLIRGYMSLPGEDGSVPLISWDYEAEAWLETNVEMLDAVHPYWLGTVDLYRNWKMDLGKMWEKVVMSIDQPLELRITEPLR